MKSNRRRNLPALALDVLDTAFRSLTALPWAEEKWGASLQAFEEEERTEEEEEKGEKEEEQGLGGRLDMKPKVVDLQ